MCPLPLLTRATTVTLHCLGKRTLSCLSAKCLVVHRATARQRCCRGIASQIMNVAVQHQDAIPLVDAYSRHAYRDLIGRAARLADRLKQSFGDEKGLRVCLLLPKDHRFVDALLAVWMCGHIGVPLCPDHPTSMWKHCVADSEASAIFSSAQLNNQLIAEWNDCHVSSLVVDLEQNITSPELNYGSFHRESDEFYTDSPALILYTSGTTGLPKGVVLSHANLSAQCSAMRQAWQWRSRDTALHVLPLHHTHGLVNVLLTPLSLAARCILMGQFEATCVWQWLLTGGVGHWGHVTDSDHVTVLMAVPTVYSRLLQQYQRDCSRQSTHAQLVREACAQVRLMVSGSAALPLPIMQQWHEATGHVLLERYGMTEIGMALSNPLHGTRTPGAVGTPMPLVEVRLVRFSEDGAYTTIVEADSSQCRVLEKDRAQEWGELLVRGPSVSERYWRHGSGTDFLPDGWFRTGDAACLTPLSRGANSASMTSLSTSTNSAPVTPLSSGSASATPLSSETNSASVTPLSTGTNSAPAVFRIVGRTSVDIIKSGGYKVSALAVERVLLEHERVQDVAVVGLPDPHWGEQIVAVAVLARRRHGEESAVDLEQLRSWCSRQLPRYSLPSQLIQLDELPRNTMGKINKKELARQIQHSRDNRPL